jgi:hypothetical protein
VTIDGGKGESDVSTSQGLSKSTADHQKLRVNEGSAPVGFRKKVAQLTP